jgi:hypothetical protein
MLWANSPVAAPCRTRCGGLGELLPPSAAYQTIQEKNASGAAVMARPVAVDGMGEENTSTQKTENHSYSLEHRRRPWPSHLT